MAGDVVGRVAVERHHRDAEVEVRRRLGEDRERLEAERAGVVVGPDRAVAELRAARGQRAGDLGVEPGGDAEAAFRSLIVSSSATHSTCGVCGNMSTGFTRRSV